MKLSILNIVSISIVVLVGLVSACSRMAATNVQNVNVVQSPTPALTPQTVFDRLIFSDWNNVRSPLEIDGYKLEVVKELRKNRTVSDASDPVEMADGKLTRDGNRVLEFRGTFSATGNWIVCDRADLDGDGHDELIVVDMSNRFTRDWIVAMQPTPHVIFDSEDYGLRYFGVDSKDLDGDGVQELSGHIESDFGLTDVDRSRGVSSIIFRFDHEIGKYVPAGREMPPPELFRTDQSLMNFLSRFGEFAFAGREDEAWDYFEREWRSDFDAVTKPENREKENARRVLAKWLATDKFYQKVKKNFSR